MHLSSFGLGYGRESTFVGRHHGGFCLNPEDVDRSNELENINIPQLVPDNVHQWINTTNIPLISLCGATNHLSTHPLFESSFSQPQYHDHVGCNSNLAPYQHQHHPQPNAFPSEDLRTFSVDALSSSSSAGSTFSPVLTDSSESLMLGSRRSWCPSPLGNKARSSEQDRRCGAFGVAVNQQLVCLGPQCQLSFQNDADLQTHFQAVHIHACSWDGCLHASFTSRKDLARHVKAEHLLICPVLECSEQPFQSKRELATHIAVEHPDCCGKDAIKKWELPPLLPVEDEVDKPLVRSEQQQQLNLGLQPAKETMNTDNKFKAVGREVIAVRAAKKRCQEQLCSVVEKKGRKNGGAPRTADSPTNLVRSRASRFAEAASFPLIFEHAILPFLVEFIPKWSGPRHVISCTRGRTPQSRRICIMTTAMLSRTRKIIIAGHVTDLLPEKFKPLVSFVFSVGQISRAARWARGLTRELPDDIVSSARNPYHFSTPCMGDSVGVRGDGLAAESTATLGPCLDVNGGAYWLVNSHPFLNAYQMLSTVDVEHPSPQDRGPCLGQGHDALSEESNFSLGRVTVTSGLDLKTTRISHDPYWEDNDLDSPLVITDWALISSNTATSASNRANILRRFPSETQAPFLEPLVKSVCTRFGGIVAGANVISSGRTSGFQRGLVCESPAYVSGEENGTGKATREWFVEEPAAPWSIGEDSWIRGGIGVEGDSGAAIVDAETNCLYGQLWGRNKYWGPGPRITFFTPAVDILDDIQEKCGLQTRPKLPQTRDDADRLAVYPSCRHCYDRRTYLDSRRSSRVSMQSMINYRGDADNDLTSIENVSELATPRDYHRGGTGVEATGSSFVMTAGSPAFGVTAASPFLGQVTSPYPQTLDIDDMGAVSDRPEFRDDVLQTTATAMGSAPKRKSIYMDDGRMLSPEYIGDQPKRKRTGN
ncbi:hypothetical protein QQS21_006740 [Conoideocrella luteorostrata]|uniref:C2H2-type domain-containing protein n=1 Tax=Conoideocrella luteorostrata TaxID=1105319 RepID=A0AAJ0CRE6_9HYPO|nr:hypothetical protein QQS21_006740 [Conoideocrella luteorostrata]